MTYCLDIPVGAYHIITAPDHCAWPNLTLLPNGEIAATIFNQPSHGRLEGDAELWVSSDGGETWAMRSQITQHEAGTVRMNVAAGLNQAGELLVLCSGWDLSKGTAEWPYGPCLLPQVCLSGDSGNTWEVVGEVQPPTEQGSCTIPFGDIVINGEELLGSVYAGDNRTWNQSWVLRSKDGGRTWGEASLIDGDNHDETSLLRSASGRLLAGLRLLQGTAPENARSSQRPSAPLVLYISDDQGLTWEPQQYLSLPGQVPAHLLQLADGTILLTYGSRIPECRGVVGRISRDHGQTWSQPFTLVAGFMPNSDHGYPSSVQLGDGAIVTAYYCSAAPWYQRYHMGVLRWNLEMVDTRALGA